MRWAALLVFVHVGCSTASYDLGSSERTVTSLGDGASAVDVVVMEHGRHEGFLQGIGFGNYDDWLVALDVHPRDPHTLTVFRTGMLFQSVFRSATDSHAYARRMSVDACRDPAARVMAFRIAGLHPAELALAGQDWFRVLRFPTSAAVISERDPFPSCLDALASIPDADAWVRAHADPSTGVFVGHDIAEREHIAVP